MTSQLQSTLIRQIQSVAGPENTTAAAAAQASFPYNVCNCSNGVVAAEIYFSTLVYMLLQRCNGQWECQSNNHSRNVCSVPKLRSQHTIMFVLCPARNIQQILTPCACNIAFYINQALSYNLAIILPSTMYSWSCSIFQLHPPVNELRSTLGNAMLCMSTRDTQTIEHRKSERNDDISQAAKLQDTLLEKLYTISSTVDFTSSVILLKKWFMLPTS